MNKSNYTGLGEPEPIGKKSLFQPPPKGDGKLLPGKESADALPPNTCQRIRTTVRLTSKALAILQSIQNQHRLETGEALPLWQALSQLIERSGQPPETSHRGPTVSNPPGASLAQP